MRGGKNKKARTLKVLEGRPLEAASPKKALAIFPANPPEDMAEDGAVFWRQYVPVLVGLGILRETDAPAWTELCSTWAMIKQAERLIAEHGILIPGARGEEMVRNPATVVLNQARQQFRLLAQSFGMDPRSREQFDLPLSPDDGDGPGDITRFLSGPRK